MLGEDIEETAWLYALAAHDYYWEDGQRNIMTDQEYDMVTCILRIRWSEIPLELQKIFGSKEELGQGAVHIKLTEEQIRYVEDRRLRAHEYDYL